MKTITTDHPDILLIQPTVFEDERGFFMETYQQRNYEQAGILENFVQDNHSSSIRSTLRGLHYQITHPQGKLVRVVVGEVFDVAFDLRKNSSHFGKWVGAILSAENKLQMWVPVGFAHGFFVLSDRADVLYKATDFFDASGERTIRWDDPDLAIDWPIPPGVTPILSEKDKTSPGFQSAEVFA